ncbi:MAG: ABC transporter ATP-binding protein [Anaerolineae bacterium]
MSQPLAIYCRDVARVYDSLEALRHVNLAVAPGEFVSLVGASGSGKSTLLRIIAGLIAPSSGVVLVNGRGPDEVRRDRGYGIVFQSPTLYGWRTVAQNIALPLEIVGYSSVERAARVAEVLDLVGLAEFSSAYPNQLSGGMQQRVALARALAYRPPLLLMDEPFAALDDVTRERMTQELLTVQARAGLTIFFVTHHLADAVFLSDRVAVLSPRPGTIRAEIPIELPRPRGAATREDPTFLTYMARLRAALAGPG